MADLSVTAASVKAGTGAKTRTGTAGATITAGQPVYKDAQDADKYKVADANASLATSIVDGIAIHAASNNQPLTVIYEGKMNIGATAVVGAVYGLSATAGGIAVYGNAGGGDGLSDLVSGMYTTVLGVGLLSTSGGADDNFLVNIKSSRVAIA